MNCPVCNSQMIWQSDFTCDEVRGCECEEGVVSYHICSNEKCRSHIELTTNCKWYEE